MRNIASLSLFAPWSAGCTYRYKTAKPNVLSRALFASIENNNLYRGTYIIVYISISIAEEKLNLISMSIQFKIKYNNYEIALARII